MNNKQNYLLISERLCFRNWELTDITKIHKINSDEKVMGFIPNIQTK